MTLGGFSQIHGGIGQLTGATKTPLSSLLTDLIAYWKFDETSDGSQAVTRSDSHGANHLTDNNTIPSATGKLNGAASLTHTNTEFFSINDNAALSTGDIDFTIAFWFKGTSAYGTQTIFAKGNNGGGTREWQVTWGGNNIIFAISSAGTGSAATVSGDLTLSLNTWYFIVLFHDSVGNWLGWHKGGATGYTIKLVDTGGAAPADRAGAFVVGNESGLSRYFSGLIDEVGFWKRRLSYEEIIYLYNSGNGRAYPFNVSMPSNDIFPATTTYSSTIGT